MARRKERNMKVIMLQDVKKVGKKSQVIEVSDGYATNFLIPRKLAVQYNEKNISQLEANKAKLKELAAKHKQDALADKVKLEAAPLKFVLQVGANGKAFGAITAKKIEEVIKEKFEIDVDRKKFINFASLKELGIATVHIELYKDVVAKVVIHIVDKE